MKGIGRDLLTLLIGLFIFSGCKNNNDIGLDVDASKQVELRSVDTASIRTTTVKEDSVITRGIFQHPFGYQQDTELGTTESNLAMQLTMASTDIAFGATSVLDSAVLVLKYGTEFYGDSVNSTYRVNVHELGETFDLNRTYYNPKTWTFGAAPIGSKTVSKFFINRTVPVTVIRKAKADTTVNRGAHLRIPLDPTYIRNKFINAPTGTYTSAITFNSYYKGIYLTQNKAQSTGKGGIVTFNLGADSSGVEIYYRNVNGTVIDTLVARFSALSAQTAANIIHQYTPGVLAQLNSPAQQFTTTFVQPLGGLRTRLTFPYADRLKALGNILINKAELVIQSVDSSLDPAPRLTLYRTDIAGQRQPLPDNNIGQGSGSSAGQDSRVIPFEFNYGGFYDKTSKRYVFIITSYLQDLIQGKTTQYSLYLAPLNVNSNRSNGDLVPQATTAARSIIGSAANSQYKMRLNITYTRIK